MSLTAAPSYFVSRGLCGCCGEPTDAYYAVMPDDPSPDACLMCAERAVRSDLDAAATAETMLLAAVEAALSYISPTELIKAVTSQVYGLVERGTIKPEPSTGVLVDRLHHLERIHEGFEQGEA